MKKIIFLLLGLALPIYCLSAAEISAESRLTEVTVYPDFALLTRSAELKLSAGEHKIIFPGIIPEIDENSLKVSASGEAQVKLYGAQVKKEFLEEVPSEKVAQLKEEIQKLQDTIKEAQDLKEILQEERKFLDSVRLFGGEQIPKDLVTKMPPAKDLDDTLKFLDSRLKENFKAVMEAEVNIRDLNKKLEAKRRELDDISGPARKIKRQIIVDLEVLKAGTLQLQISYLTPGAYWEPIYDARANFEKSEVELASYGLVKQSTGEDWTDVVISLSTAKPAIGGSMPYVSPWFLRPYQPPRPMVRAMKAAADMNAMVQYEAFKAEEGGIGGVEEAPYAAVEEKGIAVLYKLPKKATIKADGSEHKLPISSQTLKAEFKYSTYPRAVLNAYLGSRVTNAPNLQLLAGRVNIFLSGDFVGSSSIDNIGPGEEFDLYLGVDENVKVKKDLVEKKVDETLIAGIPSPTKRTTFKYKLSVENYKQRKIDLKLFEAMPISEDDRIKVKINNVSLEPNLKDWENRKGIWLWELSLEPKAKTEIFYTFVVEHPRDMRVEGL